MNYLLKTDTATLTRLGTIFKEVSAKRGVKVSTIKATLIMIDFVGEAKKANLLTEAPDTR